ncbi:MAG: AAC(3) family N-acetyltransferase [Oscillibacter sp.]|nr:AAC(3) family N-acetyltransferase [Oscillibacter sp.]
MTKEQLKLQLAELGLTPSDTVVIHTSLRSVGPVEGGADGLIDAFCEYLQDGLFLVPTHTWANVNADQPVYDARQSVPCIGAVPRAAAARQDGTRSLHPTHSLWAFGRSAADYVRGEELAETPAPPGGCWARLAEAGAKIVLIGVNNSKNTFIHSLDEAADLPDRLAQQPYETTLLTRDGEMLYGRMTWHLCSRCPDVSKNYVNFEEALTALGAQRFGRLGQAEVRVVDAAACREIILRIYRRADHDVCVGPEQIPEAWYLP